VSGSLVLRLGWHGLVGLGGRKQGGGLIRYAWETGIRLGVIGGRS